MSHNKGRPYKIVLALGLVMLAALSARPGTALARATSQNAGSLSRPARTA